MTVGTQQNDSNGRLVCSHQLISLDTGSRRQSIIHPPIAACFLLKDTLFPGNNMYAIHSDAHFPSLAPHSIRSLLPAKPQGTQGEFLVTLMVCFEISIAGAQPLDDGRSKRFAVKRHFRIPQSYRRGQTNHQTSIYCFLAAFSLWSAVSACTLCSLLLFLDDVPGPH